MGIIKTPEEYALTREQPWQDFLCPGFHHILEGTSLEQRDTKTQYNVAKTSTKAKKCEVGHQQGPHGRGTGKLRRAGGKVRPPVYTPTDDPEAILVSLLQKVPDLKTYGDGTGCHQMEQPFINLGDFCAGCYRRRALFADIIDRQGVGQCQEN